MDHNRIEGGKEFSVQVRVLEQALKGDVGTFGKIKAKRVVFMGRLEAISLTRSSWRLSRGSNCPLERTGHDSLIIEDDSFLDKP